MPVGPAHVCGHYCRAPLSPAGCPWPDCRVEQEAVPPATEFGIRRNLPAGVYFCRGCNRQLDPYEVLDYEMNEKDADDPSPWLHPQPPEPEERPDLLDFIDEQLERLRCARALARLLPDIPGLLNRIDSAERKLGELRGRFVAAMED